MLNFIWQNCYYYYDENIRNRYQMKFWMNYQLENDVFSVNDAYLEFNFVDKKISMISYTLQTIYNID